MQLNGTRTNKMKHTKHIFTFNEFEFTVLLTDFGPSVLILIELQDVIENDGPSKRTYELAHAQAAAVAGALN